MASPIPCPYGWTNALALAEEAHALASDCGYAALARWIDSARGEIRKRLPANP